MKKMNYFLLLFLLIDFSFMSFGQQENFFKRKDYSSLFNGNNLDGWKIPVGDNGHWSVIDGVIDMMPDLKQRCKNLWTDGNLRILFFISNGALKVADLLFPLPTILSNGIICATTRQNN